MFQAKVVDKMKAHIKFNDFFFQKSYRIWDNVDKHDKARQTTGDNTVRRMRFDGAITKATDT
jgi:hypothetical protein